MICHKGGLPTLRHNEVRDLTAALLGETCKHVSVEPPLQALDDEEFNFRSSNCDDEARLDIKVSDFWSKGRDAYFDVSFFIQLPHPTARKSSRQSTSSMRVRRREAMVRVRQVERTSFTPLV